MKVVVLAGGRGTRISEYTKEIPKPMIRIGNKPILSHIIKIFQSYNFNEIIIAAGYKKKIIENFYKIKKISRILKLLIQEKTQ